jgi:hypothetical protein
MEVRHVFAGLAVVMPAALVTAVWGDDIVGWVMDSSTADHPIPDQYRPPVQPQDYTPVLPNVEALVSGQSTAESLQSYYIQTLLMDDAPKTRFAGIVQKENDFISLARGCHFVDDIQSYWSHRIELDKASTEFSSAYQQALLEIRTGTFTPSDLALKEMQVRGMIDAHKANILRLLTELERDMGPALQIGTGRGPYGQLCT